MKDFKWNEIDTVLLDMDGTLLDLYFDNYFWQEYLPTFWGERNGLDKDTAKQELIPKFKNKEGTLSWYCLDYWSNELNVDILQIKSDIADLIKVRPQAIDFLVFLNHIGKRCMMVTNAHRNLISMKIERTGIDKYFGHIICAHEFGAPKEHEEFWHNLNEKFPFSVNTTLLIDDNLNVLRAARTYGISKLFSIAQPDSKVPKRDTEEFTAIVNFRDMMFNEYI